MRDEDELIRAASSGDRRAFDELVERKRERVVRTAYQITGDWEDAKDVAQGVFLRLFKVLPRFDVSRKFDTWIYRITVNAAIDVLRERGPKGMIQSLPDHSTLTVADPSPGADAALDLAELQAAFLRLASLLPPKQRAVFVLREIEGQPTEEIARTLDITESTVRNHLLQARRSLRAGLEKDYPGLLDLALGGAARSDEEDA